MKTIHPTLIMTSPDTSFVLFTIFKLQKVLLTNILIIATDTIRDANGLSLQYNHGVSQFDSYSMVPNPVLTRNRLDVSYSEKKLY